MDFFRTNDGRVFTNNVDLKRMANRVVEMGLAPNRDEALDLVARMLGERNFHALRQRASHTDQDHLISTMDAMEAADYLRSRAFTMGCYFPPDLPARFDTHWKRQAQHLLDVALGKRTPGTLSFVALVGASGSGKTVLANAHCHRMRANQSRVYDVGLYSWLHTKGKPTAEDVIYLDRPASTNVLPDRMARISPTPAQLQEWQALAPKQRTLQRASELFRINLEGIPYDEFRMSEHADHSDARSLARKTSLVISFPSVQAVQSALDNAERVTLGDGSVPSDQNWTLAHVVNLDDMTTSTLRRADPALGQGAQRQPASVGA